MTDPKQLSVVAWRCVRVRAIGLASDDALDDPGFQSLHALDLKPNTGEVVEGLSHQVVGAEAHGQRVEQSLHGAYRS
jgi:hypothetical protein